MKQLLWILLPVALVTFVSCSKDEGAPVNINTTTLEKHWFVRVQGPSTTSNYSLFSTRTLTIVEVTDNLGNQTARVLKDTLTLDDHNLLVPSLRANVRINTTTLAFGEGQYRNWNSTTTPSDSVILKEGKIIRNGGKSRTGTTVDSIFLRYAFKSAPTVEYRLNGHQRTGLIADEY